MFLLVLGLLARIFLIFSPAFKFDMDAWVAWANRINQVGFSQFYSDRIWTNYTPGFLYILYFLGALKKRLHFSDEILSLSIKLPSILAEILLAWLVYLIISKRSKK